MFMNPLNNGLDTYVDASYGGWGGRNGKALTLMALHQKIILPQAGSVLLNETLQQDYSGLLHLNM